MENKIKGFVSLVGLGVVVGIAITYGLLLEYVKSSLKMKDPILNQLFYNLKDIEKVEYEEVGEIFLSHDFIIRSVYSGLKNSGMLCSYGSYRYKDISFFNGTYILAVVDEDGVKVNPLLIRSGIYKDEKVETTKKTKGVIIVYRNNIDITNCVYNLITKRNINQKIRVLVLNIENGPCKIQGEGMFIVNEYAHPIDIDFSYLNLIDLVSKTSIPFALSYTNIELSSISFFAKKEVYNIPSEFSQIFGYDIGILKRNVAERIIEDLYELSDKEKKALKDILKSMNKDSIQLSLEENERVARIAREIKNTRKFLEYLPVWIHKYDNFDKIISTLSELEDLERETISQLLSKRPLSYWSSLRKEKLAEELEKVNLPYININAIYNDIHSLAQLNIDDADLKELLGVNFKNIDQNILKDISSIYQKAEKCYKIEKYRHLAEIMDELSITFSPTYNIETHYNRLDNLQRILRFDKESFLSAENMLKEAGLSDEEVKEMEDVFLKWNIENVDDLYNIKNTLENKIEVVSKLLSYEKLTDNFVDALMSSLRLSLGLSFVVDVCNKVGYTSNLLNFDVFFDGVILLHSLLDSNKVMKFKMWKDAAYKYSDALNIIKGLDSISLEEIKNCADMMNGKNLLAFLFSNALEDGKNDVIKDYLSFCYYKDFYSISYDAFVFNESGNLSMILFRSPFSISSNNYKAVFHPFVYFSSDYPIFKTYEDALRNLIIHEESLIKIHKEIKNVVSGLHESKFVLERLECGECHFAPNPLERIKKEEIINVVENIIEKYREDINLTVLDAEIKEEVEDLSQEEFTGCMCKEEGSLSPQPLLRCRSEYVVHRGGDIYLLYSYKDLSFVIRLTLS